MGLTATSLSLGVCKFLHRVSYMMEQKGKSLCPGNLSVGICQPAREESRETKESGRKSV